MQARAIVMVKSFGTVI